MKPRNLAIFPLAILFAGASANAANFYWDADTLTAENQNGSGNWNTTNTNWIATPGGTPNISWADGANTAFLGNVTGTGFTNPSAGGTITLDQTISLTSLSMSSGQSGSYVINGGTGITLNFGAGALIGNNNTSATLTVNAVISGTNGLEKINAGRVILTGLNTYTGNTKLTAGVLDVGTISNGSLGVGGLLFNGGVLQGNGTFTRTASGVAGAADGQISGLTGGFSARGGQLTVDLGTSFALSAGGFRFGSNLILGSSSADSLVKVTSNLDFGGANRTITVNSGVGGDAAEFSGIVSGATWGFNKAGTGLLILSGNNINTGVTTINAGTIRAAHNNAFGVSAATVALGNTGAAIELANSININRALTVSDTGDKKTIRLQSGAAAGNYSGTVLVNETGAANFDLSATGGQTLTVSGKISGTGAAGINKVGAGTVVLSAAANDYSGVTTISEGTLDVGALSNGSLGGGGLRIVNNSVLQGNGSFTRPFSNTAVAAAGQISGGSGGFAAKGGALTVNFANDGSTLFLSGASFSNRLGDNFVFGSTDSNNVVTVVNGLNLNGSNRIFTVNSGAGGDSAELQGVIAATAAVGIIKNGTGLLSLSAVNTYTGTTQINSGTLALKNAGSINSSTSIVVGANSTFNVSAVTGGYTLASGQTLSGSGTVVGSASIAGTLSPGNSPGTLTTGSQTWLDGGDYNWQILDATGAAGSGFDTIAMTGTLDLSSVGLTTGGFAINLWSLASTGPDVSGDALNFNNTVSQSWALLTASGGIIGFNAADFIINTAANNGTAGFANHLGGGAFSLATSGNNLVLNFTAVPEPAATLLGGIGVLFLLRRRRSS